MPAIDSSERNPVPSTVPALDWNELDSKAVDTARVLAMDAVQKVGNGHPGTAMSLAPAAYLLFQKVMRHNPADPHWTGRDRFVLSAGHSSITLYTQLVLGGWGLERCVGRMGLGTGSGVSLTAALSSVGGAQSPARGAQ